MDKLKVLEEVLDTGNYNYRRYGTTIQYPYLPDFKPVYKQYRYMFATLGDDDTFKVEVITKLTKTGEIISMTSCDKIPTVIEVMKYIRNVNTFNNPKFYNFNHDVDWKKQLSKFNKWDELFKDTSPMIYNNYQAIYEGDIGMNIPGIKNVIFNNPATIVFWKDGTKTVVKCGAGDTFDKEKGLAMAIAKKVYGNKGNYNEIFKKWCEEAGEM